MKNQLKRIGEKLFLLITVLLLVLLFPSCAEPNTSQSPPGQPAITSRTVQITITNSKIEASTTVFQTSTPYQFKVTNKGSEASNFIIRERSLVPEGSQPKGGVLYLVPSTQLPPGATRQFTYAFPIATPQSSLQFTTNLPGPEGTGKILPIRVEREK